MVAVITGKIDAILRACERFRVERLDVFGSVLRDDFEPGRSYIDSAVIHGKEALGGGCSRKRLMVGWKDANSRTKPGRMLPMPLFWVAATEALLPVAAGLCCR
jgi:hypothetical protein